MVPRKQGLIINISSMGGVRYLFNVAYGIGKVNIRNNENISKLRFNRV